MRRERAVTKVDPEIQGGTPCFAGTRVFVKSLFDYLARQSRKTHRLRRQAR